MRLHVNMPAPSVMKVLLFAAEAGRDLETVEADTRSDSFLRMNPFRTVPVLETASGFITESLTICRYLDRQWGGTGLFGRTSQEELEIEQWERRSELMLLLPALDYAHHTLPMFTAHLVQQPQLARMAAERSLSLLQVFDGVLGDRRFIAGADFSIADITAYLGISTFAGLGAFGLAEHGAVRRWSSEIADRVSGRILRSALAEAGF
jgi:glutathione S-transferase